MTSLWVRSSGLTWLGLHGRHSGIVETDFKAQILINFYVHTSLLWVKTTDKLVSNFI